MALPEIEASRDFLLEAVDDVIADTEGFSADQLNWRPTPADNSLFVLATHVLGAVEEIVLTSLCQVRPSTRVRDEEFRATGDSAAPLVERWQTLRGEIAAALDGLSRTDLEGMRRHPRLGEMMGYRLLFNVLTHAYEHKAHADLTRVLLQAREWNSRPD